MCTACVFTKPATTVTHYDLSLHDALPISSGTIANVGGATFTKSSGTTVGTVTPIFNNSGTVNANSGTLRLNGGGTSTGTIKRAQVWTPVSVRATKPTTSGTMSGAGTVSAS